MSPIETQERSIQISISEAYPTDFPAGPASSFEATGIVLPKPSVLDAPESV
jgi:hypothetical protein